MIFKETPQFSTVGLNDAMLFLGHFEGADLYVDLTSRPAFLARKSDNSNQDVYGQDGAYGDNFLLTTARQRAEQHGLVEPDLYLALIFAKTTSLNRSVLVEMHQHMNTNIYARTLQALAQGEDGAFEHLRALRQVFIHQLKNRSVHTQPKTFSGAFAEFVPNLNNWLKFFGMPHLPEEQRRDVAWMRD